MKKNEKKVSTEEKVGLSFFIMLLKGSKRYFLVSMVMTLVIAVSDLLLPQMIRMTVDGVLGGTPEVLPAWCRSLLNMLGGAEEVREHLWIMALAVLAVGVIAAVGRYLFSTMNALGAETLVRGMRDRLYTHLAALPYGWHMKNQTGDIMQRCTSDVDTVKNFLSGQLTQIMRIVVMMIFSFVFLFSMNVPLACIALAGVPVIIGYSYFFHRRISRRFLECDEEEGRLSATVQENLTGVRVVRAFGREQAETERFDKKNNHYSSLWINVCKHLSTFWSMSDLISGIQMLSILGFGAYFCVSGAMTEGEFIAFISYNGMLIWPIRMLGRMIAQLSKAGVAVNRIAYILNSPVEEDEPNATRPPLDGDIVYDDVTFAYDGCEPILQHISFTLPAGKTLGILGGTGSGKTTLVHLLNRLYDLPADAGTITIGGHNIARVERAWLRSNVGMVLQDPFLFSRSIAENLTITAPEAGEEKMRQAAKDACFDDSVMHFTEGYRTFVGERGVTLSGGQKQRAAIARALIRPTPILVFDDSLSAVDADTDAEIRRALSERTADVTTILIAHRVSTVQDADLILVLDRGVIAESGTHEELLAKGGLYAKIYNVQNDMGEEVECHA